MTPHLTARQAPTRTQTAQTHLIQTHPAQTQTAQAPLTQRMKHQPKGPRARGPFRPHLPAPPAMAHTEGMILSPGATLLSTDRLTYFMLLPMHTLAIN